MRALASSPCDAILHVVMKSGRKTKLGTCLISSGHPLWLSDQQSRKADDTLQHMQSHDLYCLRGQPTDGMTGLVGDDDSKLVIAGGLPRQRHWWQPSRIVCYNGGGSNLLRMRHAIVCRWDWRRNCLPAGSYGLEHGVRQCRRVGPMNLEGGFVHSSNKRVKSRYVTSKLQGGQLCDISRVSTRASQPTHEQTSTL